MGAKPDKEMLSSIHFDSPLRFNNVLIDDFSDFEDTFGEAFDLWGISQTVNAPYGTYETYDILIQDRVGNEILSTHAAQGGREGWDLFAAGSSVADLIEDEINNAVIDRMVTHAITGSLCDEFLTGAYSVFKSILSIVGGIDPDEPITVQGNTKSYIIYCDIVPTIHFVFVRDTASKPWQHSLTTNTAAVLEKHDIYIVVAQNGRPYAIDDEEIVYDKTLFPDEYGCRLTNAIQAYRYDKALYIDSLVGYTLVAKKNRTDSADKEIFYMDIPCPEDQFDFFDTDYHNAIKSAVFMLLLFGSIAVLVASTRKMRKKRK